VTGNEVLRRVYKFYPTIGTWAASGRLHWPDASSAKQEMAKYLGPQALDLIFDVHDVDMRDRAFLRLPAVLATMNALIDRMYNRQPISGGFFPK